MKPQGYTHRESGQNVLTGVALFEAWKRGDRHSFAALLSNERDDLEAAVVAVCRAATTVARCLGDDEQIDNALDFARDYGLMRRDELGGDDLINRSNLKGSRP
jgi:hypothetical protein